MTPLFRFRIDHLAPLGISPEDPERFLAYTRTKKNGKAVMVTLKSDSQINQRTELQNRYYFGVVVKLIAEEIGDDVDSVHEGLAQKFAPVEIGAGLTVRRSTRDMPIEEFSDYVEQVKRWANGFLSIRIPDPGEVDMESVAGFVPDSWRNR